MDKVYLLLRNNKEKGPFNFDELLQQKLQPFDLIWVEGKSQAWSYPSELEELRSFTNKVEAPPTVALSYILPHSSNNIKKVEDIKSDVNATLPVLSVKKDLERRAEEIKKRALNYNQENKFENIDINVVNDGIYQLKREIPLTYKTSKKFVSAPQLALVTIISILLVGWLYGDWSLIRSQTNTTSSALTTYTGNDENTEENSTKETTVENDLYVEDNENNHLPLPITVNKKEAVEVKKTKAIPVAVEPVLATRLISEPQSAVKTEEAVKEEIQTPVVVKPVQHEVKISSQSVEENAETDKKKKGGFLKGLFKKKKKDDHFADADE